ncbi:MAG: glycolate oxidase iron-sulfur subunit [Bacillota bacterium]|nr:MAG: glycolate oxidase iron-sulfur subunit [Bacillota bacterium]
MQHRIPVEELGPAGPGMAAAIEACVHCGFCLGTCPTYLVLGEEMDSPRGRIYLMKQVLEGELPLSGAVAEHLDRCLGCLACVTACPSGVRYGELLTPIRARREREAPRPALARWVRAALLATLPYPRRFRLAARLGAIARRLPVPRWVPLPLRAMLELVPESLPPARPLPAHIPAQGRRRARVALLTGCVQQVLRPEINHATARVLAANGVEVLVPPGQGCCGALALHAGAEEQARDQAARTLEAFASLDVDAIVVNAAGCGSAMKEYHHVFAGSPHEKRARALADRVRDVSEFLAELGPLPPGPLSRPARVAYHDACHLAHGQGVREAPRHLLGAIPNVDLVELDEPDLCCGSAGIYNIEQPEVARQLQERKVESILASGASIVATGNIGCLVQVAAGLRRRGAPVRVMHTMELLAEAYATGAARAAG